MQDGPQILIGDVVLPDRVLKSGALLIERGRIAAVGSTDDVARQAAPGTKRIEHDGFIAPGYIDLHVHGGGGSDFMDGTEEAFRTALSAHLRHGTTSIVPTTTVARHEQTLTMLEVCRRFRQDAFDASIALPRVLGAHLYGPHFRYEARGCHPSALYHEPLAQEEAELLTYADVILTATIAPELPQAERFARECRNSDIRLNVGHSWATCDEVRASIEWGVRHVDHLFCAMSDKTKLRATQPYPMRGGVQEATLLFDELSTEVIADGKHLSVDLLMLAYKLKGPDRLALVTDCSRALDMPDGRYLFGPLDGGEPFIHRDGVGIMPDGQGLASSTQGMDHMVRTFHELTRVPLHEVIRMATLTPARILGLDDELGSLEVGKRADMLLLDRQLHVRGVFVGGIETSG
jgi:N-acetylglucosamine-6-phosphate deacetylase